MPLDQGIYTTRALLGMLADERVTTPPPNYWLDNFFTGQIQFDTEYVEMDKIAAQRKIAPLVVPTVTGKPIYSAAEAKQQVKPAYIKLKDPISATSLVKKRAGLGELAHGTNLTPAARYNLLVADILDQHRNAVERRWEWMASEATQNGAVTLEGEAYPRTVVDFQRDAGHSIVLAGAARWGQAGVDPLADIDGWRNTARRASFGGVLNRITMGVRAWELFKASPTVREILKDTYRSPATVGNPALNLAFRDNLDVELMGQIGGVSIYVYSDYYEDAAGNEVEFMDERDIVLTGNIQGVRCFGAIQDKRALWQPLPIFVKMIDEEDPSATHILTQSAPLMVPVRPNASMKVRVTDA